MLNTLTLKKHEDKRLRSGHLWIYSNEIATPLKSFTPGEEVLVESHDKTPLGVAYINPHSLIAARLFSHHPKARLDENLLSDRIEKALALRKQLFSKPYYRLIYGESDQLPGLIVDRFNDTLAVQINTAGMDVKSDAIIAALRKVMPDISSILLRNDSRARLSEGLENFIKPGFGIPPEIITAEENDVIFKAPLWKGQKTGWFYDHRLNRARLKSYVSGVRVLDVFSYLGAWGIMAATWGAREVVCVDESPLSQQWIMENATLNAVANKVSVLTEDAFDALKALTNAEPFDLIILDPPAFVKKQKDHKEGLLAYQRINELALKRLKMNGILVSCSCSMHVTDDDFLQMLRRASLKTGAELQILERGHQGPDHPIHFAIPETAYLKMVIARRLER